MRKFFLLALPLASLVLITGCNEGEYSSTGTGFTSPSTGQTVSTTTSSTMVTTPAPAATTYHRNTTTQNLPSGWDYVHVKDLASGPLNPNGPAATTTPGG